MPNIKYTTHLMKRGRHAFVEMIENSWIDYEKEIITFPLWNLSGRLCGYQQYNWRSDKKKSNDSKGKYWTYRTKESVSVFGLEYFNLVEEDVLYVVEGVWDALSLISLGLPCIAVLSNNPKWLSSWLNTLPVMTVAVCDGDVAGLRLACCCDDYVELPEGTDCNETHPDKLRELLGVGDLKI